MSENADKNNPNTDTFHAVKNKKRRQRMLVKTTITFMKVGVTLKKLKVKRNFKKIRAVSTMLHQSSSVQNNLFTENQREKNPDIFAPLFSVHKIISLSCHRQVC